MSALTREILANAVLALRKLSNSAAVRLLSTHEATSLLLLAGLCEQAAKDREAATASAAGDELERQLEASS